MAASFSDSVKDIYLPWMALHLVWQASIEPNLHNLYLALGFSRIFWTIWWTHLWHYRKPIVISNGLALHAVLSLTFFDKAILKNLGHWLGLQTLGRVAVSVSTEVLPLWDIASCYCFPQRLWGLAIHHSVCSSFHGFPAPPLIVETFCLCWLGSIIATQPHIGLQCILEIKVLLNHLSLKLSYFQFRNCLSCTTSIILSPTKYKKLCLGNNVTISTVPCVWPKEGFFYSGRLTLRVTAQTSKWQWRY